VGDVTELLSSNLGGASGSSGGEGEAVSAGSSWGVPACWVAFQYRSSCSSRTITVPGSEGGELGAWHGEVWKVGLNRGSRCRSDIAICSYDLLESTHVGRPGGGSGVLHGVDLPVGAYNARLGRTAEVGALGELEGWGPGVGAGSPGALLVHCRYSTWYS